MKQFILSFFFIGTCTAQLDLQQEEQRLYETSLLVLNLDTPKTIRDSALHLFTAQLKKVVAQKESFDYSFERLTTISILSPEDKKFRLYTWNSVSDSGNYTFYGLLQYKHKKEIRVVELTDLDKAVKNNPTTTFHLLEPSKWYGAQYYSIQTTKYKRHKFYTLLGVNWCCKDYSQKVIDVLSFDKEDSPLFGAPVFEDPFATQPPCRKLFSYAKSSSMLLRYEPEAAIIIFDRLEPVYEIYRNNFKYYAPSFIYDGFFWDKGGWLYIADLDAKNQDELKQIKKNRLK